MTDTVPSSHFPLARREKCLLMDAWEAVGRHASEGICQRDGMAGSVGANPFTLLKQWRRVTIQAMGRYLLPPVLKEKNLLSASSLKCAFLGQTYASSCQRFAPAHLLIYVRQVTHGLFENMKTQHASFKRCLLCLILN